MRSVHIEPRLMAIRLADAAPDSRLIAANYAGTSVQLHAYGTNERRRAPRPIYQRRGRTASSGRDPTLLADRNAHVPAEEQLQFGIRLSVGEAMLHAKGRRILAGERQVVFVTGEPGVGKITSAPDRNHSAVAYAVVVRIALAAGDGGDAGRDHLARLRPLTMRTCAFIWRRQRDLPGPRRGKQSLAVPRSLREP